jgi:hypothetical protein
MPQARGRLCIAARRKRAGASTGGAAEQTDRRFPPGCVPKGESLSAAFTQFPRAFQRSRDTAKHILRPVSKLFRAKAASGDPLRQLYESLIRFYERLIKTSEPLIRFYERLIKTSESLIRFYEPRIKTSERLTKLCPQVCYFYIVQRFYAISCLYAVIGEAAKPLPL